MDPHVLSALIGLVAACLGWVSAHYQLQLSDPAAHQAAVVLVSFVVGWFRPHPSTPAAPAAD